jgi:hypothetical protein
MGVVASIGSAGSMRSAGSSWMAAMDPAVAVLCWQHDALKQS